MSKIIDENKVTTTSSATDDIINLAPVTNNVVNCTTVLKTIDYELNNSLTYKIINKIKSNNPCVFSDDFDPELIILTILNDLTTVQSHFYDIPRIKIYSEILPSECNIVFDDCDKNTMFNNSQLVINTVNEKTTESTINIYYEDTHFRMITKNNEKEIKDMFLSLSNVVRLNLDFLSDEQTSKQENLMLKYICALKKNTCTCMNIITKNDNILILHNKELDILSILCLTNKIDIFLNFVNFNLINTFKTIQFMNNTKDITVTKIENDKNVFLEQNTVITYVSRIKKLNSVGIVIDNDLKINDVITKLNQERITKKEEPYTDSSFNSFFAAIMYELKRKNCKNEVLIKEIRDKMYECKKKYDERNQNNESTEGEVVVAWDKILDLHKQIENKKDVSFSSLTDYVILSLYCMIPPKRNNYVGMIIIKNISEAIDLKKNYYATTDKTFVFNNYKTAKSKDKKNTESFINKTQYVQLNDNLSIILNEYITNPNNKLKGILFPNNTKFIFRRLIKMLKLIDANCNSPIHTLRHSAATQYSKENTSVKDRKELAKLMTHSIMMNWYYVKFPKKITE